MQTSIRTGKRDFLLRQKERGNTTPWTQIPPIRIEQRIPEFEIGLFKDVFSNTITKEDDEDEEEDQEDDLNMSNEMKRIEAEFRKHDEEKENERRRRRNKRTQEK